MGVVVEVVEGADVVEVAKEGADECGALGPRGPDGDVGDAGECDGVLPVEHALVAFCSDVCDVANAASTRCCAERSPCWADDVSPDREPAAEVVVSLVAELVLAVFAAPVVRPPPLDDEPFDDSPFRAL